MNTKTKRRLVVVTGIVIMVLVIVLAVVGGSGAAKNITVADAASGKFAGERVQVTGMVADDSFALEDGTLAFDIYDPEGDHNVVLYVEYSGASSSTFGNGITAICTGVLSDDSSKLVATEMITKCPSKYESAADVLSIERLLDYGQGIVGKPVKILGTLEAGSLKPVGSAEERFVLIDADGASSHVSVLYDGALSNEVKDNTQLVVSGALTEDGVFMATEVALKG